jgi:hypothetical protein
MWDHSNELPSTHPSSVLGVFLSCLPRPRSSSRLSQRAVAESHRGTRKDVSKRTLPALRVCTVTPALDWLLPPASRARAFSWWLPLDTSAESQESEYGAVVSVPMSRLST